MTEGLDLVGVQDQQVFIKHTFRSTSWCWTEPGWIAKLSFHSHVKLKLFKTFTAVKHTQRLCCTPVIFTAKTITSLHRIQHRLSLCQNIFFKSNLFFTKHSNKDFFSKTKEGEDKHVLVSMCSQSPELLSTRSDCMCSFPVKWRALAYYQMLSHAFFTINACLSLEFVQLLNQKP